MDPRLNNMRLDMAFNQPVGTTAAQTAKLAPNNFPSEAYPSEYIQKEPFKFNLPNMPQGATDAANKLATGAPYLYDLARGAFDKAQQYNAQDYMQNKRLPYRDVDFSPIKRAIDQQGAIARANAASASGGDAGSFLSNQAQIGANTQNATAEAQMKAQQYNLTNRYNVDVQNLGIDQANKNLQFQIDQMNQANKSKRSEYIGKGLEGLSGLTQQRLYEKNQMSRDNQYMDLFKQMYPFLNQTGTAGQSGMPANVDYSFMLKQNPGLNFKNKLKP